MICSILWRMSCPPGAPSSRFARRATRPDVVRQMRMMFDEVPYRTPPLRPVDQGDFAPDAASPLATRPGDLAVSRFLQTEFGFLNEIKEATLAAVARGLGRTNPIVIGGIKQEGRLRVRPDPAPGHFYKTNSLGVSQ